jgi:NADH:ubiquinone oxidoreductase subunit E
MKKKMTTVTFTGTPEQEAKLDAVIAKYGKDEGAVMRILQDAQDIYGYLPLEVQRMISIKTGVPLAEIYGVATFYSQFSLNPKGQVAISVCLGTACYVKGAGKVIEKISEVLGIQPGETSADGKFSLDATRCLGACGLAPVITVNEDVYGKLKPEDVKTVLEKY